ncbi:MAG: outer membrane protein transport protein [Bacteroidota bacterium]|nr:outer membrane protein transport protein [Bacteroidota bacterium]
MKRITLAVLLLALCSWTAYAGGYQVRLQGQKQTGMGLVGSPLNFGASSIFFNPGGLSFMKDKFSISAGVSPILGNVLFEKAQTPDQFQTDNPVSTPFSLYFAVKIGDHITLGLGAYTPFGSTTKWQTANDNGASWAGRYLIQEISFSAIFIQPTIAYKFLDKFSIGAGLIYAIGNVDLQKALPYNDNSTAKLEGSTSNIGYNIGFSFVPNEKWSLGIDYRSEMIMKIEGGDATFKVPQSLSTTISSANKFDAELPLPANLDIGVAFQATEKWLIALEFNYVFWSVYKSLDFSFEENSDLLNSTNKREYSNSLIIRAGAQYSLTDKLDIRFGGYYDPTPTNEQYFTPETVSLNTVAWTAGLSYRPIEMLSIDISFAQLHGLKSEKSYTPDNFSGTYKTVTNLPGIGVSFNF